MSPENRIRVLQMIRKNILEHSGVDCAEIAAEIARRWAKL